jgi:hypothetical protein
MADSLPVHVALVSEIDTSKLSGSELSQVSAALQKQVSRDFGPIWGVNATVDSFASLDDVPLGYWPVIVMEDIGDDSAAGFHQDKNGNPFALVQFSETWSLTASHETLEMLADPFGNRVIASIAPEQSSTKGRVEILVEVSDPSEDISASYQVNGIVVSDFYTPSFFDPVPSSGKSYSFTGAIKKPRQVLKGGYISFHDLASDHWLQVTFFGTKPEDRDLGILDTTGGKSLRAQIDRLTTPSAFIKGFRKTEKTLTAARAVHKSARIGANAKAKELRAQIKSLTRKR